MKPEIFAVALEKSKCQKTSFCRKKNTRNNFEIFLLFRFVEKIKRLRKKLIFQSRE
jgi:hypothetical protein